MSRVVLLPCVVVIISLSVVDTEMTTTCDKKKRIRQAGFHFSGVYTLARDAD